MRVIPMREGKNDVFLFVPPPKPTAILVGLIVAFCVGVAWYRAREIPKTVADAISAPAPTSVPTPPEIKDPPPPPPNEPPYRENERDTARIFETGRECAVPGVEPLGVRCGMTFLRVQAELKKAGYEIRRDEDDRWSPGMPPGLSCGDGNAPVCSAGYRDAGGRPSEWALIFDLVEGSGGSWVLTGEY